MNKRRTHCFEFDCFRVDPVKRLLLRQGIPVTIASKVFDTLLVFLENPDRMIGKNELLKAVWPETFVEEDNLTQAIYTLRRTLNERPSEHRYIVTIPGSGYRFIPGVKKAPREESESTPVAHDYPNPTTLASVRSIAVLPFRSLTDKSGYEYLQVGIPDALSVRLSKIRQVAVFSTTSLLRYANPAQDSLAAGRELSADFVITGIIQGSGARLRVTVQLVRVSDGTTVWAGQFDENFSDIFNLEDSICEQVIKTLELTLAQQENVDVGNRYRPRGAAYQAYLKGRYFLSRRTSEGLNSAIKCFDNAIVEDPNYALAYAGLGGCYNMLAVYGLTAPLDAWHRAKEVAVKALSIDNALAEAHACLALTTMGCDWDWQVAKRECQVAIACGTGCAMAHDFYAEYLMAQGSLDEARTEVMRALELEPLSLVVNRDLGCVFYFMRRYDEAIKQLQVTVEIDPNFAVGHWTLAWAYEQNGMYKRALAEIRKAIALSGGCVRMTAEIGYAHAAAGDRDKAEQVLDELAERSRRRYVSPCDRAIICTALGDKNLAFQYLESALEHRPWALVYLKVEPKWDPLRSDPRFQKLLQRAALHQ